MGEGPLPQREPPAPRSIKKEPHLRVGLRAVWGRGSPTLAPRAHARRRARPLILGGPQCPNGRATYCRRQHLANAAIAASRVGGREGRGKAPSFRFASSVIAAGRSFPPLLDDRDLPKGFELTSLTPLYGLYDTVHNIPSTRRFIPHGEFLAVGARLLAF